MWKTSTSRVALERWARSLERHLDAGLDPDATESSPVPTVGKWHERWWAARVAEPTTLAGDRSRLDVHVLPRWASVPVDRVATIDVQAWVRDLSGRLGADTVRTCHGLCCRSCSRRRFASN